MDSILDTEFYPKVRKLQLSLWVIKLHKITQSKISMGKITQHSYEYECEIPQSKTQSTENFEKVIWVY